MAASEPAFRYVVDANVVLKLYFEQAGSDQSRALFMRLRSSGTRFYAPDLLYAECINAFASYARLKDYPATEARRDATELLWLRLHVVPMAELAAPALEISLRHQITGYDACYVALAARLPAPLITADEKLVRAVAGQGYPVQSLATFAPPR